MKKVGCVGAIVLFVLGLGISVEAQMTRPLTIGLNFGQYESSLDFWNTQFRNEGSDKTFGWGAIFGGSLALGFTPHLRLRLDASRWNTSVVEDQAHLGAVGIGTDDIAITLTPITISGVYYFPLEDAVEHLPVDLMSRLSMYTGVGGGLCLVKVERTRSAKENTQSEDMTGIANFFGHILLGLDLALTNGLSLSGEYKYALGKYVQQEKIAGVDKDRDVSISGPQFGLSLKYTLFGGGYTKHPSPEELSQLDGARMAADAAEKKLEEKKSEKVQLEAELAQKKAELEALKEKRDAVKSKVK